MRDHKTPDKRSQQNIMKMLRIFKFLPPMRPIHIDFLPVLSNEKISILKMAEELIGN